MHKYMICATIYFNLFKSLYNVIMITCVWGHGRLVYIETSILWLFNIKACDRTFYGDGQLHNTILWTCVLVSISLINICPLWKNINSIPIVVSDVLYLSCSWMLASLVCCRPAFHSLCHKMTILIPTGHDRNDGVANI